MSRVSLTRAFACVAEHVLDPGQLSVQPCGEHLELFVHGGGVGLGEIVRLDRPPWTGAIPELLGPEVVQGAGSADFRFG